MKWKKQPLIVIQGKKCVLHCRLLLKVYKFCNVWSCNWFFLVDVSDLDEVAFVDDPGSRVKTNGHMEPSTIKRTV